MITLLCMNKTADAKEILGGSVSVGTSVSVGADVSIGAWLVSELGESSGDHGMRVQQRV